MADFFSISSDDGFQAHLNPYKKMVAVSRKSPEELEEAIHSINSQFKVLNIVADGGVYTAFIIGDFSQRKIRQLKGLPTLKKATTVMQVTA